MSDTTTANASIESREEAGKGDAGTVKFWLAALDLAEREEADWSKSAAETEAIYRGGTKAEARDKFRQITAFEADEVVPAAIGKAFGIDLGRVHQNLYALVGNAEAVADKRPSAAPARKPAAPRKTRVSKKKAS